MLGNVEATCSICGDTVASKYAHKNFVCAKCYLKNTTEAAELAVKLGYRQPLQQPAPADLTPPPTE